VAHAILVQVDEPPGFSRRVAVAKALKNPPPKGGRLGCARV